jgi:ABC-type Fe3+-hydroxamate transport system substrate-binding protein
LRKAAEQLVQLKPDVIFAAASAAALAAKQATSTIPIVVGALGNPIALGLAESDYRRYGTELPILNVRSSVANGGKADKICAQCEFFAF